MAYDNAYSLSAPSIDQESPSAACLLPWQEFLFPTSSKGVLALEVMAYGLLTGGNTKHFKHYVCHIRLFSKVKYHCKSWLLIFDVDITDYKFIILELITISSAKLNCFQ